MHETFSVTTTRDRRALRIRRAMRLLGGGGGTPAAGTPARLVYDLAAAGQTRTADLLFYDIRVGRQAGTGAGTLAGLTDALARPGAPALAAVGPATQGGLTGTSDTDYLATFSGGAYLRTPAQAVLDLSAEDVTLVYIGTLGGSFPVNIQKDAYTNGGIFLEAAGVGGQVGAYRWPTAVQGDSKEIPGHAPQAANAGTVRVHVVKSARAAGFGVSIAPGAPGAMAPDVNNGGVSGDEHLKPFAAPDGPTGGYSLVIGTLLGGNAGTGTMRAVLAIPGAFTPAHEAIVTAWAAAAHGAALPTPTATVNAFIDSITYGQGATTPSTGGYFGQLVARASASGAAVNNLGRPGRLLAALAADLPGQVQALSQGGAGVQLLSLMGGVNDLRNYNTPRATVSANLKAVIAAWLAESASHRVFWAPILPAETGGASSTYEADRVWINADVSAYVAGLATGLSARVFIPDVSAAPIYQAGGMNVAAGRSADGLHPNDTGHTQLATLYGPTFDAALVNYPLPASYPVFAASGTGAFVARSLTDPTTNVAYNYKVWVPAGHTTSRKWPTILALAGTGEIGTNNTSQIGVGLGAALSGTMGALQAVCVFPQQPQQGDGPGGNLADEFPRIADLALAAAELEFNGDPARRYLTGLSLGSNIALNLAWLRPKSRFAALLLCSTSISTKFYNDGTTPTDPNTAYDRLAAALAPMPIWMHHSPSDSTAPYATATALRDRLRLGGCWVQWTDETGGHVSWDPAYQSVATYQWMFAQGLANPIAQAAGLAAPQAALVTVDPAALPGMAGLTTDAARTTALQTLLPGTDATHPTTPPNGAPWTGRNWGTGAANPFSITTAVPGPDAAKLAGLPVIARRFPATGEAGAAADFPVTLTYTIPATRDLWRAAVVGFTKDLVGDAANPANWQNATVNDPGGRTSAAYKLGSELLAGFDGGGREEYTSGVAGAAIYFVSMGAKNASTLAQDLAQISSGTETRFDGTLFVLYARKWVPNESTPKIWKMALWTKPLGAPGSAAVLVPGSELTWTISDAFATANPAVLTAGITTFTSGLNKNQVDAAPWYRYDGGEQFVDGRQTPNPFGLPASTASAASVDPSAPDLTVPTALVLLPGNGNSTAVNGVTKTFTTYVKNGLGRRLTSSTGRQCTYSAVLSGAGSFTIVNGAGTGEEGNLLLTGAPSGSTVTVTATVIGYPALSQSVTLTVP